MKNKLTNDFIKRQYMSSNDYEIFYYHDVNLQHVSTHSHNHYEFYFFLEGEIEYEINGILYSLKQGDFLLIPPGIIHRPIIHTKDIPYRRFILWLSEPYYQMLCTHSKDFSYGYDYVKKNQNYHLHPNVMVAQDIQSKFMDLIEEIRGNYSFHDLHCNLKITAFLAFINRSIYDMVNPSTSILDSPLYLRICEYINSHLTLSLSLDTLAKEFYVSKYHIAHEFKDHMGVSTHQYIMKKRLQAVKSAIPSGVALTQLATDYGFSDYTSFYRAFKKEYGLSPKEYKEQHQSMKDYETTT